MALRDRSIRFRVGILIAVPVLSLIALYFFAASFTLGGAVAQAHARRLRDDLSSVSAFQAQLDRERHVAMLSREHATGTAGTRMLAAFSMQWTATEHALDALRAAMRAPQVVDNASAQEKGAIGRMLSAISRLRYVRSEVTADAISLTGILAAYDSIIDSGFPVISEALEQQTSVPLETQAQDLVNLARVGELATEESDLLTAATQAGPVPGADQIAFAELASQRQELVATTMADLQPSYRSLVTAGLPPSTSSAVARLEDYIIATPWTHPPAQFLTAPAALSSYNHTLLAAANQAGNQLENQARHQADTVFVELLVAGALGLVGIIASVALSLLLGRSLVHQLRELRSSALTLAQLKLPQIIRQLRAGQQVDMTEGQHPARPTRNEIEQVRRSFGVLQQAAVQSAVDEARLRRGVSEVFRNLAGRSLSLLQRQLTLLDAMERRATEPSELENLFRIDHLTTRMRRHAEGLIILSGNTPARAWRHPVQLIDVLRASVAEVEDYTRIRVLSRTTASLAGHAVADVIHLIAELAENATVFSPPNTPVRIQGDLVGRGFAVEIEDRGLGISAARLAEINASLADPPEFDPAGSDRLGLFIAGQLAKRHDIKITLQPSVYAGTTAVVFIPLSLVVDEDAHEGDPALPAGQQAHPGRHAVLVPAAPERNGQVAVAPESSYPPPGLPVRVPASRQTEVRAADNGIAPADVPARLLTPPAVNPPADVPARLLTPPVATPPAVVPPAVNPTAVIPPAVGPTAEASVAETLDDSVTTTDLTKLGLPVRVRQASLAPQLRDPGSGSRAAAGQADTTGPTLAAPVEASPEAARDTMSALQRGWQLGRAAADNDVGDEPGLEAESGGSDSAS